MSVIFYNSLHLPPISAIKYRFRLPPCSDRRAGHFAALAHILLYSHIGNYLNDLSRSLRPLEGLKHNTGYFTESNYYLYSIQNSYTFYAIHYT